MDDDLASLQAKLKTYGDQMVQVEGLIQQDPTNQEWLKLKSDITEVMQLTTEYVKIKTQEARQAAQSSTVAQASPAPVGTTAVNQSAASAAVGAETVPDGWKPIVGQACEASFDKRWYPVHVTAAHEDEAYSVVFYTHNNSEVVEGANLRPLMDANPAPIDKDTLESGQACQARFAADGTWYASKIDSVSERGCMVTFTEYGNQEEVPFLWIRLAEEKATKKQKRKAKRDGLIQIPASLHILPTDSETDKKRKQKRVKVIKNKNKRKIQEVANKKKQTSWLKFHKKTKGRRIKGSMNSLGKRSIFSSPDSLEGRVGVTGSGQGMTEFNTRKKYRLNSTGANSGAPAAGPGP